ncbi:50S ribosomal protein L18e [Candidatus Woesearchaeota archaeon]|nr:50S ribosomal protein L18e [Candidatus Woesearchaeota archaeon]
MSKKTGPTNPELMSLIKELRILSYKQKVNIWKRIAEELERPTRQRRIVNLERINRVCKNNESIIVPGKVLASGDLDKKLTVAAFQFSEQALNKINEKGKALTIQEIIKINPKGSKLRIIG